MYKRVLLKLSGESLGGPSRKGIDEASLLKFAKEIKKVVDAGYQVAVVNGGGNIFRGLQGLDKGYDRVTGDRMGMLATVINSLALASALRGIGVNAEVFTATKMEPIAKHYDRDEAIKVLENGGVSIIAGGTGNPYFSTDSGAALRALELKADALLKGTRVDGVYNLNPETHPEAVKYDEVTFDQCLSEHLKVMDATAYSLCEQGPVPIIVFNINIPSAILDIVNGKKIGTIVHA